MKKRFKPSKFHIIISLVALFVVACSAVGYVGAKYVKDVPFSGSVTVSADLVEQLELYEHKAVRNGDGTYKLLNDETDPGDENKHKEVASNQYILMPGVDIPKDPQIRITNKTAIDAYLYIEVVDGTPATVEYALDDCWAELDGVTGKNGGKVYVYVKDGAPVVLDEAFDADGDGAKSVEIISILKDGQITVSQEYLSDDTDFTLSFHAYMAQKISDALPTKEDAKVVFNDSF